MLEPSPGEHDLPAVTAQQGGDGRKRTPVAYDRAPQGIQLSTWEWEGGHLRAAGATVATVGLAAGTASASTVSGGTHHGYQQLTPMTGPLSHEAELATVTTRWQHAGQPYALTDAGRTPVLEQLRTGWREHGQVYARNQEFTELHNSSVTELAFGQRSHGGYQVLTEQGGRLVFEPLNWRGAAADQLWTWAPAPGNSTDSWSFKNVGTGQYLTAGRHGGVGISSQPFFWQQIELPAA